LKNSRQLSVTANKNNEIASVALLLRNDKPIRHCEPFFDEAISVARYSVIGVCKSRKATIEN